jgi:hypothetical protein
MEFGTVVAGCGGDPQYAAAVASGGTLGAAARAIAAGTTAEWPAVFLVERCGVRPDTLHTTLAQLLRLCPPPEGGVA